MAFLLFLPELFRLLSSAHSNDSTADFVCVSSSSELRHRHAPSAKSWTRGNLNKKQLLLARWKVKGRSCVVGWSDGTVSGECGALMVVGWWRVKVCANLWRLISGFVRVAAVALQGFFSPTFTRHHCLPSNVLIWASIESNTILLACLFDCQLPKQLACWLSKSKKLIKTQSQLQQTLTSSFRIWIKCNQRWKIITIQPTILIQMDTLDCIMTTSTNLQSFRRRRATPINYITLWPQCFHQTPTLIQITIKRRRLCYNM